MSTETETLLPGSDAATFIQWKGTNVCLDFHCPCGVTGHYDGDFAYAVRCAGCGDTYELGTQVVAKRTATPAPDAKALA